MAAYLELFALPSGADNLRQKIIVATVIKANTIAKLPSPTASQKAWAIAALLSPAQYMDAIQNYILAEYNTAATTAITGATDAQVQAAVNAAVDTLFGA